MVSLHAALTFLALSAAEPTVLLDFCAEWCGPCRAMEPTIQALVAKGYPVQKVNVDRDRELAARYNIRSVPCYVMLVDGQERDRVLGGTTFSRLERMFQAAQAGQPLQGTSPVLAHVRPGAKAAPPPARGAAVPPPVNMAAAATAANAPGSSGSPAVSIPAVESSATLSAMTRQATPAGWVPREPDSNPLDSRLIAASVRLRIEDADGHSCGSGTIIDARKGEALILTCGHIFRESRGKGRIEVDLFGPNGPQQVSGRLISYDLDRDVGLVCIRAPGPVAVCRVAPPGYRVTPGAAVVSVGCNNGDRPTARHSRVTSKDRFLGPPNVQVAGQPVEGRSGGGLFTEEGLVIGVCNAADPADKEGLYAALASIQAQLDKTGLSFVCQAEPKTPDSEPVEVAPRAALVAVDPPPMPKQMPKTPRPLGAPAALAGSVEGPVAPTGRGSPAQAAVRPAAWAAVDPPPRLGEAEQAALDEIRRRLEEGAEVICVVRPRHSPAARSEVIMLDKASPEFLQQLAAEARGYGPRQLTSLEVPRTSSATPSSSPNGYRPGSTR